MTSNRIALAAGWTAWPWLLLRPAGFPANLVLDLASPATAAAADALAELDRELAQLREQAVGAVLHELETMETEDKAPIKRVLRKLRRNNAKGVALDGALASVISPVQEAAARSASALTVLDERFSDESRRISLRLQEIVGDPRFREALVWQNPQTISTALEPLRRAKRLGNSQHRQHEWLVASYLQRYCVKNDTIGFFGPFGWGLLTEEPESYAIHQKEALRKRTVYFEHWAMEALANALSEDDELRIHLAPRRMATVRVVGTRLHYGVNRSADIPLLVAAALALCDGETPATEIAAQLRADATHDIVDDVEVFQLLETLADRGLLVWALEVPTGTARPDEWLRQRLARMPKAATEKARTALGALEESRRTVARSAGDPRLLADSLAALGSRFEGLTGSAATRRAGQMYAGRTVVFEDCQHSAEIRLGRKFLEPIAPALSLLLQSARWYTHEVALRYRERFEIEFDRLRSEADEVDYVSFYDAVVGTLPDGADEPGEIIDVIVSELDARWQRLLSIDADCVGPIERTSDALGDAVADVFSAPHPGWPMARYHSPDLLVCASSIAELSTGASRVVLGEMHSGSNTMTALGALAECPAADAIARAIAHDVGVRHLEPVIPSERASRIAARSPCEEHFDLEIGRTRSPRPRDHVLVAGELRVRRVDGNLVVETRDGKHRFDIIEAFEYQLMVGTQGRFTLMGRARHRPRISIDTLVIRQQWRLPPEDLDFAFCARGPEQFARARRWARAKGVPRWVFVKVPEERKPIFLDFASPLYIELAAKQIRSASRVVMSEMLPDPEQLWFSDGGAARFTSEIRTVAVDPVAWRTPEPKP